MPPAADFFGEFQCLDCGPGSYVGFSFWTLKKVQQDLLEGHDLVVIKFVLEIAKLYKDGL